MTTRNLWARGVLAACMTWLVFQGSAQAQVEDIGPMMLPEMDMQGAEPGFGVWLDFDNEVLPDPAFKILDFFGQAVNESGQDVTVNFKYDYLDGNQRILVEPGNPTFVIPPDGSPHTVDPGLVTIVDFCPPEVSLHIEADGPVMVSGQFTHLCVPEPSTASLVLAGSCLCLLPRRRRR